MCSIYDDDAAAGDIRDKSTRRTYSTSPPFCMNIFHHVVGFYQSLTFNLQKHEVIVGHNGTGRIVR